MGLSDGVLRGGDGYDRGEAWASPGIPRCEAGVVSPQAPLVVEFLDL